jgi:predicted hotdog family 3-hydroxylacyl-ACP dehydratase
VLFSLALLLFSNSRKERTIELQREGEDARGVRRRRAGKSVVELGVWLGARVVVLVGELDGGEVAEGEVEEGMRREGMNRAMSCDLSCSEKSCRVAYRGPQ